MVIRGYLSGHAARLYKSGKRKICGMPMPDGMIENDKFEIPIITPTTKAADGNHDEDISKEEIIKNLREQQMKCLSISHRTRVIVDLTTSCERRKDHIIETMRRKKAMYFWRFRTTDKFLHRWKDHTVRLMEIRENCEVGEGYFYKKKATLYVKRWLIFTHRKEILKKQFKKL